MIYIKALIWKRYIEMKNNKKLWIFLILPIICLIAFYFLKVPQEKLYFYFCIVMTYISFFLHWNPENIVYSGYLLVTPITSKKNWLHNALVITLSSYFYSYLILIIGEFILGLVSRTTNINISLSFLGLVNLPLAFALILSSTICNVDYSLIKQYLQIPFVIIGLTLVGTSFFYNPLLPVGGIWSCVSIIAAIILITLCLLVNVKNNHEKLFINTKKVIDNLGNVIDD